MQQKLLLNRGQGRIWTWFKLDRRWWNAPLFYNTPEPTRGLLSNATSSYNST